MAEYGLIATQSGRDVSKATDYDQVLSSSWPSLRTAQTGRMIRTLTSPYNLDTTQDDYPKIKHGLGYTPLFYYFDNQSSTINAIKPNSVGATRAILAADSQYLYWLFPGFGGAGPTNIFIDFSYTICPINLQTNFTAPVSNAGTSQPGTLGNVGMKIVSNLGQIDSPSLEDFILDTDARSPSIHQIVSGVTDGSGNASVTYDLPYKPMFLAYTAAVSNSTNLNLLSLLNGFAALETPGNNINIVGVTPHTNYSIVIFKDPFLLGETLTKVSV